MKRRMIDDVRAHDIRDDRQLDWSGPGVQCDDCTKTIYARSTADMFARQLGGTVVEVPQRQKARRTTCSTRRSLPRSLDLGLRDTDLSGRLTTKFRGWGCICSVD
jgi:hypothetical protein